MTLNRATLAYLAVLVGVCGHASSEFFSILSGVQGPETSVWRYTIGSAGLLAAALIWPASRNLWEPLRAHPLKLAWLSVVGFTLAYLAFHWSLDFATAVQVGTLVTTVPLFVGFANLIINKVAITTPKIVSGTAAVIGVALLLTDGYLFELAGREGSLFGVGLALACAALVAIYAVAARPLINEYGPLRITAITMTMGTVVLWVLVGAAWGVWVNPLTLFDRPPQAAWSLLILGVFNTTITQLFWLGGLAAVPDITRGSYLFFLKPVITALLAVLILLQPITAIQIIAIIVICGAVVVEMAWPYLTRARARG